MTRQKIETLLSKDSKNYFYTNLNDQLINSAIENLGDNDLTNRKSAVLIPLIEANKIIESVIVMTRTMKVSTHKGQISFPGGMVEDKDKDLIDTALRETDEEIGVQRQHFEVIGTHSPVGTRTNFEHITPVIGICSRGVLDDIRENKDEVETVHIISIQELVNVDAYMSEIWDFGNFVTSIHMYFVYDAHSRPVFIWGATASMLTNLLRCITLSC